MARDPEAVRRAATSLMARIKTSAKAGGVDTRALLTRFALERWLHRLVVSGHGSGFVLKGGMIMPLLGEGYRPTEDIDGHWEIELSTGEVADLVDAVSRTEPTQEDGLEFDTHGMRIDPIREGLLPGTRVTLRAWLRPTDGNPTEVKVKMDLCYGDAITPAAIRAVLPPSIKGLDPVSIEVFPWATVVSEKVHAIARHGLANTRMKDFYDLLIVSRTQRFEGRVLVDAVLSTFRRWGGTMLESHMPGLSREFSAAKGRNWNGFLKRGGLQSLKQSAFQEDVPDFGNVVAEVGAFVLPVLEAASTGAEFNREWHPGRGWQQAPVLATV